MNNKEAVFGKAAALLANLNLTIEQQDATRPWGGFYVINETQAEQFAR
ncbi:MAG: hypothetical protein JNM68_05850, partial [Dinghuibacter sp.]|nr:hypothetical protein [Dinghuibacter sp.]